MSRSRRRTPITGITGAKSEKYDKTLANRTLRKRTKEQLRSDSDTLPLLREVSDAWDFGKELKRFFDLKRFPKLLRK